MESTLSLQLSDLAEAVAFYLGYGRLTTSWTGWQAANPYVPDATLAASNLADIMNCVAKGLRSFYTPKLSGEGATAHKWSFLSQQRTITTTAGVTTYLLPDDYGGLEGELTYPPSQGMYLPLKRTGIGEVNRVLSQAMAIQIRPRYVAIHLTNVQGAAGQRWQATFAPTPDSAYTLTYIQRVLPQMLTYAKPWPLGGEQHAETIMEACLAAAEAFLNDEQTTHQALYLERLQASISLDVQENAPTNLGYNRDRSDQREQRVGRYGMWPWGTNEPTYNGVPWSHL